MPVGRLAKSDFFVLHEEMIQRRSEQQAVSCEQVRWDGVVSQFATKPISLTRDFSQVVTGNQLISEPF
jgi:hypothetical protein